MSILRYGGVELERVPRSDNALCCNRGSATVGGFCRRCVEEFLCGVRCGVGVARGDGVFGLEFADRVLRVSDGRERSGLGTGDTAVARFNSNADGGGVGCCGGFDGGSKSDECGVATVVDGDTCAVGGERRSGDGGCDTHSSVLGVDSSEPVGKWNRSNKKKRERKRGLRKSFVKEKASVPEWRRGARPTGFCETVVTQSSSCPSYGQAVSDAEREAKESLAKRRAAENALQEKLAKMKLADLEDEQKCQEYATLKRQRVIQWTNEATAKSQQSLDKCKSIDPGSSSSQFEIRKQAKELADTKMQYEHLVKVFHDAVPDAAKIIAMTKLPGTESMERYRLEGEFIGGWGDDHSISS